MCNYGKKIEINGTTIIESIEKLVTDDICIYNNKITFLNNITCKFIKGNIYGIIGKNGTGKTTLLNSLIGINSAEYSGSIFYNNIHIEKLDMYYIRKKEIAYVEQSPIMFNMKVIDYLKFGYDYDKKQCKIQDELLMSFNIKYLLNKEINENGNNLSGGEKQKLVLVKALSKNCSLILLDEPSSALDSKSVDILEEWLRKKSINAIIIMVTHDSKLIDICDEVIELK